MESFIFSNLMLSILLKSHSRCVIITEEKRNDDIDFEIKLSSVYYVNTFLSHNIVFLF
jgi:hypothetical protein